MHKGMLFVESRNSKVVGLVKVSKSYFSWKIVSSIKREMCTKRKLFYEKVRSLLCNT